VSSVTLHGRGGNVTKKLSQGSEPSPGLSNNRFKLRPQRRVDLEPLIDVPLRFRVAPLLKIADAAIEEGQGTSQIEDERLTKICRSGGEFALVTSAKVDRRRLYKLLR
jgi:hypothetical protein